jgi:hypothetical protein
MAGEGFVYVSLMNPSTGSGGTGSTAFNVVNNVVVTGGTTNVVNNFTNQYAGPAISAGAESQSSGTVKFSNSNNISFGMSSGVVTASASNYVPTVYFANPPWQGGGVTGISNLTLSDLTNKPLFFPFKNQGNLEANELHFCLSRVTNGSNSFTVAGGIYSHVNSSQISLIGSDTHFFVHTGAATAPGVWRYEISMGTGYSSLTPGAYVLGLGFSHDGSTSMMNQLLIGDNTVNKPLGMWNEGSDQAITHASHQDVLFWGRFTATSNGLPAVVALSQVIGGVSGASGAMPMYWTLGNHV